MEAQNDPGNQVRASNHERNHALGKAHTLARLDAFTFPQNETHFSKQVTFSLRWICGEQPISASQDSGIGRCAPMAD
jgi:hypothetical protein